MFETRLIYFIYRQTGESASYKNQTGYLVAFVVCLVLLIPSFVANIVLIRSFKCNQPKQRKQGKIYRAAKKINENKYSRIAKIISM